MARKPPKIVVIVGPTASGKTALSLALGERFKGELVSADSCQIYRGMDIGTAKPTKEEQRLVPHHLIDIKDPNEGYAVAEYKHDAVAAIKKILERGRLPIMVGGTGLYVNAVVLNLDIPKVAADPELRKSLEREIEEKGLEAAFKRLIALDPEAAYVVDPKNPRRIVRALEVALTTGRPFTAQRGKSDPIFDALVIGIDIPPETLRARINDRIDLMIKNGLVREVEGLVKKYGGDIACLDAIGYRETVAYFKGECTQADAIAAMKMNTWHYAKRQITWFKKTPGVHWIKTPDEAMQLAHAFIAR